MDVGNMILVFASYKWGEHLNVIKGSIKDAVEMIKEYCIENGTECYDASLIELENYIKERLKNQDNIYIAINDGTWYTITSM